MRDACGFPMDGHRQKETTEIGKKKCRRGEEIENMELDNQSTTSRLKSSPMERGG